MRKIYMVTDLDNTLLNSNKQISEKNLKAIQKLVDAGHYFGIATGRSYESAYEYVKQLPMHGPSIFCNGCMLKDKQGNMIHEHTLVKENLTEFLETLIKEFPHAAVKVFLKNEFIDISNRLDEERNQDDHPAKHQKIAELWDETWYKILIIEKENPQAAYQLAADLLDEHYHFMFSDVHYLEIMPQGVSKGQALKDLAKEYDCFSVAVGDYENDVEMIEMADFGVAVENALDCVKQKANYIGKHHDEDAIADIIEKVMKMAR